jgi:hypothetical protein
MIPLQPADAVVGRHTERKSPPVRPAGGRFVRRALREARAAPDRAPAVLLDSLPASASTGIVL